MRDLVFPHSHPSSTLPLLYKTTNTHSTSPSTHIQKPPPPCRSRPSSLLPSSPPASSQQPPQQPTNTFELLALRNGSPIHFSGVQASESRLTLKKAKQGASCTAGPADNHAIFELLGENLYLYDKPRRQQMWVDRSGMGQGILGYSTGAQSLGKNFEQTGWKVDKNGNLNFKGSGLIACPSSQKNGPWSIWVSAGVNQPGGNKGCVPFTARVIKNSKPTGCEYSVQK
ncbi:hypothetical protein CDV31_014746 [Fusarium ambrosium]|uniref:Cell wall protein PhiA n=1 Tax=Fusarium ambrosium TaxID=131363 RepID=A0A428SUA9_9HYPO|nr:hypothetical protein CDV31_014746 [Fusarium ambrosium]